MSEYRKELFLTEIAEHKGLPPLKILRALTPHNIIYAHGKNLTRINGNNLPEISPSIQIAVLRPYLDAIYSHGTWEGNKIKAPLYDENIEDYYLGEYTFAQEISLSVNNLFVYADDLVDLESRIPDVFTEKPGTPAKTEETPSPRVEENLYGLVGILLDMLVERDGKYLPLPEGKTYVFKNQADLIAHIEKYEVFGLKKSSLEEKFSKANSVLREKTA